MKNMIKNIAFIFATSVFLSSCGGGGGSSASSTGFAPADATAFETKFVNQAVTSSLGGVSTILPNQMFSQVVGGVTVTLAYTYTNTGANTATSSYTISGTTCIQSFTFTSALAGDGSETCTGNSPIPATPFTFTFSGSN